jgi:hypothetical protein
MNVTNQLRPGPVGSGNVTPVEECPHCDGRRLKRTREERRHAAGDVLYTGLVSVIACKTCRAVLRDESEEEAFVRAVEMVASKAAPEGEAPRKIRRCPDDESALAGTRSRRCGIDHSTGVHIADAAQSRFLAVSMGFVRANHLKERGTEAADLRNAGSLGSRARLL